MKDNKLLIGLFALFVLSIFTPWFTYNPKVMGYCWGFRFLPLLIVPIVIICIFLLMKRSKVLLVLSELSALSILSIYTIAFGRWQEFFNISSGYHWGEGFHTATIGYWISLGLCLAFAVLLQIRIFIWKRNGNK